MKFNIIAWVVFLFLAAARAQTTDFTYQGRLSDGTNPANGSYDFRFQVYNADSAVVAGPLTNAPVGVTNGLFTVTLDFGAGVFDGGARSLEIGVRTNGDTHAYTVLSPRQTLTSVPYAIQALNAATAAGLTAPMPATNLAGTIPNSLLSPNVAVLTNNVIFSGSVTATNFTGNGPGLMNLDIGASGGVTNFSKIVVYDPTLISNKLAIIIANHPDPAYDGEYSQISSNAATGYAVWQMTGGSQHFVVRNEPNWVSYFEAPIWTIGITNDTDFTSIAVESDRPDLAYSWENVDGDGVAGFLFSWKNQIPTPALAPTLPIRFSENTNSRNLYVDVATGNDSNSGTTELTKLRTLTRAFSLATNGYTIHVGGGVYSGMSQYAAPAGIAIVGSGQQATIIEGGGVGSNTVIKDLTVRHTLGFPKDCGTLLLDNIEVDGNYYNGLDALGIQQVSGNLVARNCYFHSMYDAVALSVNPGATVRFINCRADAYNTSGTNTDVQATRGYNLSLEAGSQVFLDGGSITITNPCAGVGYENCCISVVNNGGSLSMQNVNVNYTNAVAGKVFATNGPFSSACSGESFNNISRANQFIGGFASTSTTTDVLGATGWTNTFGVNAMAYVTATEATLYNESGTALMTFGVITTTPISLHPGWYITGTTVSGTAIAQ